MRPRLGWRAVALLVIAAGYCAGGVYAYSRLDYAVAGALGFGFVSMATMAVLVRRRAVRQPLERLYDLEPYAFQELAAELLRAMTRGEAAASRPGPDGGVDVEGRADGLAFVGQVKRYGPRKLVGEPDLRDLHGTRDARGADRSYFITTSGFSRSARAFHARHPNVRSTMTLISGMELVRLLERHRLYPFGPLAG